MVGFMSSFLFILSFSIVCFGTIVFDLIELMIVDVPKSPVRRGSRGCSIPMFSVVSPRNPASMKIIIAFVFLFLRSGVSFSLYIRKRAIQIRKNAIILCINGKIFGVNSMNIGTIRISDIIAMVEPISVSLTA